MMCPIYPDTNDCCHDYSELGCVVDTQEMCPLCVKEISNTKCSATESPDYSLYTMAGLIACETTAHAMLVDLPASLAGKLSTKLSGSWKYCTSYHTDNFCTLLGEDTPKRATYRFAVGRFAVHIDVWRV